MILLIFVVFFFFAELFWKSSWLDDFNNWRCEKQWVDSLVSLVKFGWGHRLVSSLPNINQFLAIATCNKNLRKSKYQSILALSKFAKSFISFCLIFCHWLQFQFAHQNCLDRRIFCFFKKILIHYQILSEGFLFL